VGDEKNCRTERERRRIERNIKSYRYYKLSKPCVGSN